MASGERAAQLGPGSVLAGFTVEAVAGRGGMGVVYRARQSEPDRTVALKVIMPGLGGDERFRTRFRREASAAARIEHQNVIPVYAVGEVDGLLYIAMRFVDGVDLASVLAREQRLDPARAVALVDQIAQALDAAHAAGLVHRDVKPANVLLAATSGREHVYLTDFGLSRLIEGNDSGTLTATGEVLGTIDYLAPEQALGARCDARTDVYALGCVLFNLLTGQVPYPLPNHVAKIYAHAQEPPPRLSALRPGLPAALEGVLQRAMAKRPEDRYLSAGDLGRAALAALGDQVLSRAERSVATGQAAPSAVAAVPPRPQHEGPAPSPQGPGSSPDGPARMTPESTRASAPIGVDSAPATAASPATPASPATAASPASPPATAGRTHHRPGRIGVSAGLAALVVVAAVVVVLTGSGGISRKGLRTVGIVLGRRIEQVRLGAPRAQVNRILAAAGYTASPGFGPPETDYKSSGYGIFVGEFYGGRLVQVKKYNDPTISIRGITINSTARQAERRLPRWRALRCPKAKLTILFAPDGRTRMEFPLNPDQDNRDGANGVGVTDPPETPNCG